jgi:hypothetical protein
MNSRGFAGAMAAASQKRPWKSLAPVTLALVLAATHLPGQSGVAVPNWTVPPYTERSSSGGITTMADATPPRVFIGVTPCRLVDTRTTTMPNFPAGYGPPALSQGAPRNFDLNSDPQCTGIPAGVSDYSLNITVTNTQGPGFIKIYPTGGSVPADISTLNYLAGQTVANAAIVPAGTGGSITVIAGVSGTDLIIDINGYFADTLGNPADFLHLVNNNPGGPSAAFGNSATALRSSGVLGTQGPAFITPAYVGAGVRGESTTGGVLGVSQSQGVDGSLVDGSGNERAFGILGFQSTISYPPEFVGRALGVLGWTNGLAAGSAGVVGYAPGTSGSASGVVGVTLSPSANAAGVRGIDGTGSAGCNTCTFSAGVRGESFGAFGVEGISNFVGVTGYHIDISGNLQTSGFLGATSTDGLQVHGNSFVTGTKSFVEPHPTDPSKVIRYISLEGNESGTYFRGRGKFQNGLARIPVPEDFRIVTDPEGLTVQVTPIGAMATVAVMKMDLQEIVVQSSRDVEFSYTVNGIRHAYRDAGPIVENDGIFVPMSRDAPMMGSYPPVIRQRLISNGTYNVDGTVNMDTARRLGWDKAWEERARPAPQPAEP